MSMNQSPDDVLIQSATKGDKDAFTALYDRYLAQIYRHVYYRVGNQADAQDITQEVFVRAWKAICRYKKGEALFVSWLLVIARNLITDFYRARKKDDSLEERDVQAAPESSPEMEVEKRFERDELRKAISKLKKEKKKVLLMRFIDGFSYAEISRALRKSEGAIRVIQCRALLDLKNIMNNQQDKENG